MFCATSLRRRLTSECVTLEPAFFFGKNRRSLMGQSALYLVRPFAAGAGLGAASSGVSEAPLNVSVGVLATCAASGRDDETPLRSSRHLVGPAASWLHESQFAAGHFSVNADPGGIPITVGQTMLNGDAEFTSSSRSSAATTA